MLKKLSKMLGIALTVTLLASLLSVAAPAAALTAPVAVVTSTEIDDYGDYILRFEVDSELTTGDSITITFPAGTRVDQGGLTIAAPGGGFISIQAADGWVGGNWAAADFAGATAAGDATARTITINLVGGTNQVGEGAEVRIHIDKAAQYVQNPGVIDEYTLSVATSVETTGVASNTYSITEPIPQALPGNVYLYNEAGYLVDNWNGPTAIATAIANVNSAGSVIKISAGTYDEDPIVNVAGVTFKPFDGDATEDVMINGTWTISATDNTNPTILDGLTLAPDVVAGGVVIDIQYGGTLANSGNLTTIQNCVISSNGIAAGNVIQAAAEDVVIDSCTIDATALAAGLAVADDVVEVLAGGEVTVKNSTITVDAGDNAVNVVAAGTVTMTDNSITGGSGVGYNDVSAAVTTATITGNTFDSLETAIMYDKNGAGSELTATMNTIKNSTIGAADLATTVPPVAAVSIDSGTADTVTLEKNKIMDNSGYSLVYGYLDAVTSNASDVKIVGNEFTGNAWGLKNFDTDHVLPLQLNYWGAESGPTVTGTSGTGDAIATAPGTATYKPWTNASTDTVTTGGTVAAANDIVDAADTVGITYTSDTAHGNIALMKYTANPASVEPPAAAIDGGYYDVYSPDATGKITVMFFNTSITQDTKVYYYDSLQQKWMYCDVQGVAANNAYVYVKIGETGMVPQPKDLKGTVFTLVTQKTIPNPPASASLTPAIGATEVSITPLFTWEPVAGAARYEVTVADEPSFAIPILSNNKEINFFGVDADDALEYDTTYYWRVRAVLEDSYAAGVPTTAYQVGIFTTEAEPVEATGESTAPVVNIDPVKPEVKVEIPPTKITVEPAAAAIPTYILWIIVVVGAVLIIALIVLIVRTRRA